MSTQLATLEAEALKLSPEDRVLLADHVLASLRGRDEIEEAWGAEVDRRLAEVEAGTVSLTPVEQAVQCAPSTVVKCSLACGCSSEPQTGVLARPHIVPFLRVRRGRQIAAAERHPATRNARG
jgi:putative addiction module component (TIGR02574 family)